LITGVSVRKIIREEDRYKVFTSEANYTADIVVNAAPAWACSMFLDDLLPELADEIGKIKYSPMAVVALGFSKRKLTNSLDGFGFLVPAEEKRKILGALWTSSIFPGYRSPEGYFLIRVMMGGARWMDFSKLSDDEVLKIAKSELEYTMGISCEPDFVKILRWARAIPQYNVGHWALREKVKNVSKTMPGLWIGGNAFHGIGINDCTGSAFRISEDVREYILSSKS